MARKKSLEKAFENHCLATAEVRAERLKRVRNMANLSRAQMCEQAQVNINTYKGWEIARYGGLTRQGALKVIQCVHTQGVLCTLDWLMYGIGVGPKANADFHTALSAPEKEGGEESSLADEEQLIINELLLFRQHYKDAADLMIEDDSMHPLYIKNDYVAGVKRYGKNILSTVGMNCIVQTQDGQILLRHLRAGSTPDTYTLVSLNIQSSAASLILENIKLASAAPVVWSRRKNP